MKITYYLEILSSWCHWAEPAWKELQQRFAGQVEFEWRVALMRPEDFPVSQSQCDWFYQRSGGTVMHSPYKLSSGWFEAGRKGRYEAPNYVAEAGRDLGIVDDRLRLALSKAALIHGRRIGEMEQAVAVGAEVLGLNASRLRELAESQAVQDRVRASTAEFYAHQVTQRPTFVITDPIGDKAVFSGLVRVQPLLATIEAMLTDTAGYVAHREHFGAPPAS